jgi:hypothetical protein
VSRRLKQGAVVFALVFVAAQAIRPDRAKPPTDLNRTIQAQMGTSNGLVGVLDRSCNDCHSNATVWPWYTHIAPTSWLMAYAVAEGRKAVNFSEWAAYGPERQRALLGASCRDVRQDRMPGVYTVLHPEMRLSSQDIETICAVSREVEANAADRR